MIIFDIRSIHIYEIADGSISFFTNILKLKLLITYVSSFKGKEGYKENIKLSNDKNEVGQKKKEMKRNTSMCRSDSSRYISIRHIL